MAQTHVHSIKLVVKSRRHEHSTTKDLIITYQRFSLTTNYLLITSKGCHSPQNTFLLLSEVVILMWFKHTQKCVRFPQLSIKTICLNGLSFQPFIDSEMDDRYI